MKWERGKIGALCDISSSKRIFASEYVSDGVPFYRGKEIVEKFYGVQNISTELFISRNRFEEIINKFGAPTEGDILLSSVGTLGIPYLVRAGEEFYFKDGNLTWFRDFRSINSVFLFYWLQSPLGRAQLGKSTIGTSQSAYTISLLKQMEIDLPPIPIQEGIASILSSYDDLIENNRRRMALLEESARLLFQEWFVRLRFPGHEHTRIIDGVPEGWEYCKLSELTEITMGQSPKSKFYNTNDEGLPFHQGVADFGERFVFNRVYCSVQNRLAEGNDILCSVRAPVGRLNITLDRIVIGRGLAALRSKLQCQSLLFQQLKTHFFKEDMIGSGSIFASVTKKELENQKILCPTEKLIKVYENSVQPIDEQLRNLFLQNQKLRQARDLLLPRLMSGEIAV